jgi:hypothetical protein
LLALPNRELSGRSIPVLSTVTGRLTRNVTDVTRRKKMKGIFEKLRYSTYSPSQESSRANFEPKAGLFVKAKSFGSNFNKNLAGLPAGRQGFLWPERVTWEWRIPDK